MSDLTATLNGLLIYIQGINNITVLSYTKGQVQRMFLVKHSGRRMPLIYKISNTRYTLYRRLSR